MGETEREIALHEAAHAEVGVRLGWRLKSATLYPPATQFAPGPRATRRQSMAISVAGHLAERIMTGQPTADAFDVTLYEFFDHLGSEDIASVRAHGLAAAAPEDDVYNLAATIDSYSTRARGWAQFRHARSTATQLLMDHWDAVEDRARKLPG